MERDYGDCKCWVHCYRPKETGSYMVQSIHSYIMRRNMTIRHFFRQHFGKEDGLGSKWSIKECTSIFEQHAELKSDLQFEQVVPSCLKNKEEGEMFFWIGNPHSSTGLHADLIDWNLNLQVIGRKLWKFYSPQDKRYLYLETKAPVQGGLFSPINPFEVDNTKYPDFQLATEYEVIVEPGDIIYVPFGWFHAVQSLSSPTMNVSYALGEVEETWESWAEAVRLLVCHFCSQLKQSLRFSWRQTSKSVTAKSS